MKKEFWLTCISACLLAACCEKESLPVTPTSSDLQFGHLAKTWDEGIPLGNATVGTLVWQRDSVLRFSLDRTDLWDLRPMDSIAGPNNRFAWVCEQVRKGDYLPVQKKFDHPYNALPAPSKIPGAALEFPLNIGKVFSVHLFLNAVNSINEAEKDGCKIMSQSELMNGFANITSATKEATYAAMTQNDQTVYFYSFYAYMSWNFNSSSIRTGIKCISQSTYDLMSPTDLRRQWWDPTGKAEVPATSYNQRVYQNRKFTARSTADAVGDFAFMRISEMYLTAAEAFARSNQDAKAKEYLQALLKERDPEYKDLGNTGAKLADEIMTHRRIELWGEGFRWFDLKRLGLPLDRTGSNFDATFCGFLHKDPNADGWIFEIPKKETDFNDLIEKNY